MKATRCKSCQPSPCRGMRLGHGEAVEGLWSLLPSAAGPRWEGWIALVSVKGLSSRNEVEMMVIPLWQDHKMLVFPVWGFGLS